MNRATRVVLTAASVIVLLLLVWFTRRVVLLLFAGALIAVVLTSLAGLVRRLVPIRHSWALALVLLFFAGAGAVGGYLAAGPVAKQASEMMERLPQAFERLTKEVKEWGSIDSLEEAVPDVRENLPSGGVGKLGSVFSSTFEALSGLAFVIFTAIFLAANPGLYRGIVVKLFPPNRHEDARAVIDNAVCTLKLWLLGQSISMAVVGVLTGVALSIAGVPFAIPLGILAGLAEFVPIAGPILAAIPALLIGFAEGPDKLLAVAGIMLAIQFLESNVMMPLVQKRAADLPPIVTLTSVFVFGAAFGLLGMFVATPLAAVILVLIDEIYLKRQLKSSDRLLETRCSE